ncbi:MAG: Bifunctional ligase/repressor BirA [Phycisphaerae bacterium]|nr:Bifunctional ligase/repressor BirA [Phycisphaerae bacterium]
MHRPLAISDILARGPLGRLGNAVVLLGEVDSTNSYLRRSADDLPDGTIVAAEYQTAGRGRLGRVWRSPRGSSILLSVLLLEPADSPIHKLATTLAALAACEAIREAAGIDAAVRWPNDVAVRGRKVAGVLAESTSVSPARESVNGEGAARGLIIGVGINCLQQSGHFPAELAPTATSLEIESAAAVDRARVAGALVGRLDRRIAGLAAGGAAGLLDEWRAACDDVGTRVELCCDGAVFRGTIVDIADNADLIVQLEDGGRRHFAAATSSRHW